MLIINFTVIIKHSYVLQTRYWTTSFTNIQSSISSTYKAIESSQQSAC